MANHRSNSFVSRCTRLLLPPVAIVFGCAFLWLLPTLLEAVHSWYRTAVPVAIRAWIPLALVLLAGAILQWGSHRRRPRWVWLDAFSDKLLGRPLSGLVVGVAMVWLICWIPHYLTWPWWADLDHFSMMAHAWDTGILPYRDDIDYNFPGPVYAMWGLGKLFGWNRTMPALVVDAAVLVGFGVALGAWSRARFGRILPGMCGYLFILADYLGLDYAMVAQRDWYAALFVVFGLMALEAKPGRVGRWIAASLFGASLAFRPYGVLFIPAYFAAISEHESGSRASSLAMLKWLAAAAAMTLIAFAPLLFAGVFDDFVRSLRYVQPGGGYNQNSPADFAARLLEGIGNWRYFATLASLGCLTVFGPTREARTARTWMLALVCVAFYKPLSPVAHNYLDLPRVLFESVALIPITGWLLMRRPAGNLLPQVAGTLRVPWWTAHGVRLLPPTAARLSYPLSNSARLLAIVSLLFGVVTTVPVFCLPRQSLEAAVLLARRGESVKSPPGSSGAILDDGEKMDEYSWSTYLELLHYLRASTRPQTRVANVLRKHPFPAVNGPTGRLTPFPSVGGVLWLRWLGAKREQEFAQSLETAGRDTVVVWVPGEKQLEPTMNLPLLCATIERCYEPEARFGVFEVWRRKPDVYLIPAQSAQ